MIRVAHRRRRPIDWREVGWYAAVFVAFTALFLLFLIRLSEAS